MSTINPYSCPNNLRRRRAQRQPLIYWHTVFSLDRLEQNTLLEGVSIVGRVFRSKYFFKSSLTCASKRLLARTPGRYQYHHQHHWVGWRLFHEPQLAGTDRREVWSKVQASKWPGRNTVSIKMPLLDSASGSLFRSASSSQGCKQKHAKSTWPF